MFSLSHHNPPPTVEGEEPEGIQCSVWRQPNRIAALMAGLMLLAAITVSWLKVRHPAAVGTLGA